MGRHAKDNSEEEEDASGRSFTSRRAASNHTTATAMRGSGRSSHTRRHDALYDDEDESEFAAESQQELMEILVMQQKQDKAQEQERQQEQQQQEQQEERQLSQEEQDRLEKERAMNGYNNNNAIELSPKRGGTRPKRMSRRMSRNKSPVSKATAARRRSSKMLQASLEAFEQEMAKTKEELKHKEALLRAQQIKNSSNKTNSQLQEDIAAKEAASTFHPKETRVSANVQTDEQIKQNIKNMQQQSNNNNESSSSNQQQTQNLTQEEKDALAKKAAMSGGARARGPPKELRSSDTQIHAKEAVLPLTQNSNNMDKEKAKMEKEKEKMMQSTSSTGSTSVGETLRQAQQFMDKEGKQPPGSASTGVSKSRSQDSNDLNDEIPLPLPLPLPQSNLQSDPTMMMPPPPPPPGGLGGSSANNNNNNNAEFDPNAMALAMQSLQQQAQSPPPPSGGPTSNASFSDEEIALTMMPTSLSRQSGRDTVPETQPGAVSVRPTQFADDPIPEDEGVEDWNEDAFLNDNASQASSGNSSATPEIPDHVLQGLPEALPIRASIVRQEEESKQELEALQRQMQAKQREMAEMQRKLAEMERMQQELENLKRGVAVAEPVVPSSSVTFGSQHLSSSMTVGPFSTSAASSSQEAQDRAAKARASAGGKARPSNMSSAEFHAYQILIGEKKEVSPFASAPKPPKQPKRTTSTDNARRNWTWSKQASATEKMSDDSVFIAANTNPSTAMNDNSDKSATRSRPLGGSSRRLRGSNRSLRSSGHDKPDVEAVTPNSNTATGAASAAATAGGEVDGNNNTQPKDTRTNKQREEDVTAVLLSGGGDGTHQVGDDSCCIIL